ncbi:Low-density lipoprotein receptor-related protein 4 [Araneus ventricosus]|uniref:Low-density lipoprotein receptor-related protein 4 n=1 Tax=Araneus ventricosus TaxID=182803 RepID=A0A4Y2JVT4_ARAVE|nr:Low-density lipoprotein receptor-related protein 4 [Araneus ventricosus]
MLSLMHNSQLFTELATSFDGSFVLGKVAPTHSIPELIGGNASVLDSAALEMKHKYFMCNNSELISLLLVCNQENDCRDGSDEKNCSTGTCKEFNFKCYNNECVSMATYCDYKEDCDDGSDEVLCNFRPCSSGEFRCKNGQCIPQEQRCDLLFNCHDKSDESLCKGKKDNLLYTNMIDIKFDGELTCLCTTLTAQQLGDLEGVDLYSC